MMQVAVLQGAIRKISEFRKLSVIFDQWNFHIEQ